MTSQKNTGHLCSVYCPACGKVTDKISWNLLREAKRVDVTCPLCGGATRLEYEEGRGALVLHNFADSLELAKKILDASKLQSKSDLLCKASDDEDANLTPEKIKELYDGVEKRIDELTAKAKKRLAKKKKNRG